MLIEQADCRAWCVWRIYCESVFLQKSFSYPFVSSKDRLPSPLPLFDFKMSTVYYDRTTSSGYRFPPVRPHTTVGVRTHDEERTSHPPTASKTPGTRFNPTPQRSTAAGVRSATTVPGEMDAVARDRILTNTILNARRRDRLW